MGGYTSSSVATIPEDQFCCQCGCCPMTRVPGFDSLIRTEGILAVPEEQVSTPDATFEPGEAGGSVPLTGRFYFESSGTLKIDFPGGLDVAGAGGIGLYLRVPESVETCTPTMSGRSVFNPVAPGDQEGFSWDPINVPATVAARPEDGFGVLLGLSEVTRVDQVCLAFATDNAGVHCLELLGYALLDLDPAQVGVQDLLVEESRLAHDAGDDAAQWQPSAFLGPPAASIQAAEDSAAIDGASSVVVAGFVDDPLQFVAVDRAFASPLDLTGARMVRLWIYTGPAQTGGQFVLQIQDANGAAHTFEPLPIGNGWQELTYDLTAAWTQGANIAQLDRLTVGITNLGAGWQGFRLDTVRALNLVDPEDRTRGLLGLDAEPDAVDQIDAMEQPADWVPHEEPAGADPAGTTFVQFDPGQASEGAGSLLVTSDIAEGVYGIDRQLAPPLDVSERNTLRVAVRPSFAGQPFRAELEDAAGARYVSPVVPSTSALAFEDLTFDIEGIGYHIDARAIVRVGLRVVAPGAPATSFHADDLRLSEERTLAAGFHFVPPPAGPAVLQLDSLDNLGSTWSLFDPQAEATLVEDTGFFVEGGASFRIDAGPNSRNAGNQLSVNGDFAAAPIDLIDAVALVLQVAGNAIVPGDQITIVLADGLGSAYFPPQPVSQTPGFHTHQFDLADLSGPVDLGNVQLIQPRFQIQAVVALPGGGGPAPPPTFWIDDLGKVLI